MAATLHCTLEPAVRHQSKQRLCDVLGATHTLDSSPERLHRVRMTAHPRTTPLVEPQQLILECRPLHRLLRTGLHKHGIDALRPTVQQDVDGRVQQRR
eukprot:4109020-Prymnesium_polylepis.2